MWNVGLCREVQDWEVRQLLDLLGFLYGLRFGEVGEDSMRWECPKSKGVFSIFSFYHRLMGGDRVPFPWKECLSGGLSVQSRFLCVDNSVTTYFDD